MRLLVVAGSPPESSLTRSPARSTTPQPPGPGLPRQAPSVNASTDFTSARGRSASRMRHRAHRRARRRLDEAADDAESRLAAPQADRRQRLHAFLRAQQVAAAEDRQPALRPFLARQNPQLLEPFDRQRVAVARRRGHIEAQQLEPIAESAFANHVISALRIAAAREQMPKSPQAAGREAQDDQVPVGTQNAIDLAQAPRAATRSARACAAAARHRPSRWRRRAARGRRPDRRRRRAASRRGRAAAYARSARTCCGHPKRRSAATARRRPVPRHPA